MEMGVVYALCAGVFWGTSPVLVKRGLAGADVSAATLYQQATILLTLLFSAFAEGDLFTREDTREGGAYICRHRHCRRLHRSHVVRQERRSDRRIARPIAQQFVAPDYGSVGGRSARRAVVFGRCDRRHVYYLRRFFRDPERWSCGRNRPATADYDSSRAGDALLWNSARAEKTRYRSRRAASAGRTRDACNGLGAAHDARKFA